jgi:hypothetical protein
VVKVLCFAIGGEVVFFSDIFFVHSHMHQFARVDIAKIQCMHAFLKYGICVCIYVYIYIKLNVRNIYTDLRT